MSSNGWKQAWYCETCHTRTWEAEAEIEQQGHQISAMTRVGLEQEVEISRLRAALERLRGNLLVGSELRQIADEALAGQSSHAETGANPRAQELFTALLDFLNQWKNRGETTSLYEWHQRMKSSAATAEAVLSRQSYSLQGESPTGDYKQAEAIEPKGSRSESPAPFRYAVECKCGKKFLTYEVGMNHVEHCKGERVTQETISVNSKGETGK